MTILLAIAVETMHNEQRTIGIGPRLAESVASCLPDNKAWMTTHGQDFKQTPSLLWSSIGNGGWHCNSRLRFSRDSLP